MSGMFQVLDAADPDQLARWKSLWLRWPEREPMAHPDYARLFTRAAYRVMCAMTVTEGGGILYPFILRPLAAEPWSDQGERGWDISTPYGYGGAFAWGVSRDEGDRFWTSFDAWALGQGVVASFARLSLFEDQRLAFNGVEEDNMPNVVRALDLTPEALWRDYAPKVRKNVNTARRAGLEACFDTDGSGLDGFIAIYLDTMQRRGAADAYHFPREFFETLIERLRGQYVFCHVYSGARMLSSELVLLSANHMYSFLGGTLPEAFAARPNDLLKHAVIEWGMAQGKSAFVLGGGYAAGDGIFQYKRYFAPEGVVSFKVGRRIFDEAQYRRLLLRRAQWEGRAGGAWAPKAGYFPAYRG